MIICVFALGCGGQRESAREPSQARCIVRISDRGTFADGEPMSRADAVAHCKRAPGGAVVVTETSNDTELAETKSALEREGIRVYMRGRLCDSADGRDCWPREPAGPIQPKREIQPQRELVEPPTP